MHIYDPFHQLFHRVLRDIHQISKCLGWLSTFARLLCISLYTFPTWVDNVISGLRLYTAIHFYPFTHVSISCAGSGSVIYPYTYPRLSTHLPPRLWITHIWLKQRDIVRNRGFTELFRRGLRRVHPFAVSLLLQPLLALLICESSPERHGCYIKTIYKLRLSGWKWRHICYSVTADMDMAPAATSGQLIHKQRLYKQRHFRVALERSWPAVWLL